MKEPASMHDHSHNVSLSVEFAPLSIPIDADFLTTDSGFE